MSNDEFWEKQKAELLKHEMTIREMLEDWCKQHADWICNFDMEDYPPTFVIDFAKLQAGNRAGIPSYSYFSKSSVYIMSIMRDDELAIPEPLVTAIVKITGLACKHRTLWHKGFSTYKLWSRPNEQ